MERKNATNLRVTKDGRKLGDPTADIAIARADRPTFSRQDQKVSVDRSINAYQQQADTLRKRLRQGEISRYAYFRLQQELKTSNAQ